jgi:predicted MPP superfamily phosphohydrolase
VSFRIVHLSDTHFGEVADLRQIRAVEELVPDLDARVIVL